MSELEQYSRINNVEVKGVPTTQGENCVAIIEEIGKKIECPVTTEDIDVAHPVPAKEDENIIVRFYSREKKTEFVKKAKKARITTSSIGFTAPILDKSVYVNDHLTPENKRLFAKALALKKEKGWKFVWVDNCRIKARKTEDSRVYRISGVDDIAMFT
ncbi:uncharacterized protein LOC144102349 [Amblyomma americanum]